MMTRSGPRRFLVVQRRLDRRLPPVPGVQLAEPGSRVIRDAVHPFWMTISLTAEPEMALTSLRCHLTGS
jgi:hypothetical protein